MGISIAKRGLQILVRVGARLMAGRLRSREVEQVFGWALLGVAALIIIKDVILK